MRILILGAGGFIGSRLAARLAADGHVNGRPIGELVLFDLRPLPPLPQEAGAACKLTPVHGDLCDAQVLQALFAQPVDVVFHLAATLTLDAESDFGRGLQTNVLSLIGLLERCRVQVQPPVQGTVPMLLFASSISTFGGDLPAVVGDGVFQAPATSYGTHKAVAELLLADYSRHGFVDGRALRLPIVVTHPGPASGSISDQVSALVREPARGRALTCQMAPHGRMAVASVDTVVGSFLHLAGLPESAVAPARSMNLPGLTVTPAELAGAAGRRFGAAASGRVAWQPDPQVQQIVEKWPQVFTSERALALGIRPDRSVDAIVQAFIDSEQEAP